MPPNTPLQTDERRALVLADWRVTLAPLAAKRQPVTHQSPFQQMAR
jgi:hypothetical protein